MNLIISFSGRAGGNCDQIAEYLSTENDRIVHFRELNVHPCGGCSYECFHEACKYRDDDIYTLYSDMYTHDKTVLIIPMYCGNPASLYFIFHERCQDYFMHNDTYDEIIRGLYIIGVYGSKENAPDFIPVFEKWFCGSLYQNHVIGVERHFYNQTLGDSILDAAPERAKIDVLKRLLAIDCSYT